ncbi:copper amine oxidase N-terminal domain-containing protein [uncultured Peptoniphilus sp.]|uniref:copper amine oxidase N-terminal domain-containing protein n=1 Tax=uncultured Peptoniphilus sp. TaxID=254354 RepID=UPI002634D3E9|nr:copper amine oxidase N-terminal domain-containing protein [uncultured Peptoniphilus sp.]
MDNRTFVPIRVIAEDLGATVNYNKEYRIVTIRRDKTNILLTIGDDIARISSDVETRPAILDAPAFLRNDRTYLPLRSISELFGMEVDWDGGKRAVYIKEKSYLPDYINRDNALEEVLERLSKLGIFKNEKVYFEVDDYEMKLDGGSYEGYLVTLRKDNPIDENLTEMMGQYFINKKGTLLMEYDVVNDNFKLLIGVN